MPFDGKNYTAAPIIPPIAYHPQAIATPHALGGVLEAAYYCARKSGRLIGYQTAFVLSRRPRYYSASLAVDLCYQTAFVDWTRMLRWLPAHATAIRCVARWKCVERGAGVLMRARLIASDGVTTETGPTNEGQAIFVRTDTPVVRQHVRLEEQSIYEAESRVELASLTLGQDVQIALQAYAMDGSDTEKVGHWLLGALLWWESEG